MFPESSPNPPNQNSEENPISTSDFEKKFEEISESFEYINTITDPVSREYELILQAKKHDVPVENYRRMLETYCQNIEKAVVTKSILKPVSILDQRFSSFVEWLRQVSIIRFSILIGEATLLAAMISFVLEIPTRHQESINQARETIRNRREVERSESRVDALEFLNRHCSAIFGMEAPKAFLANIQLNQCYQFSLNRQSFSQFPPQFYEYKGMNLSYGDLEAANFEGANLRGANFEGANLQGANFEKANLQGANLRAVNLRYVNFKGANLDQVRMSRSHLQGANFANVQMRNARFLLSNLTGANFSFSDLENTNFSRAKLNNADFYNANLKGANLSHAQLREQTILIGANLENANLHEANFASINQLKRSTNWEQAKLDPDWETTLIAPPSPTYKIGLVKDPRLTIFDSYEKGIKKVPGVELITVESNNGIESEAKAIHELQEVHNVDAILLRPQDPIKSASAIRDAYFLGTIVLAIGDCLSPINSPLYLLACYESNSYQMGYDSAVYMTQSASRLLTGKPLNIGLVDGASSARVYPYFKGLIQGLQASRKPWKIVHTIDTQGKPDDLPKVKEMLEQYPEINVLWGGSDATSELALQGVKELGLREKILVYGILDLTADKAKMLLDPQNPLQLLVDENPKKVAEAATKKAVSLLNGSITGYEYHVFPHRLLTQNDDKLVQQLLENL